MLKCGIIKLIPHFIFMYKRLSFRLSDAGSAPNQKQPLSIRILPMSVSKTYGKVRPISIS